jgi:diadenosine tetraphosphate (Ap4A) HIT family hydrolase
LVGSVLVQRAPGLIPGKVLETDYTLVIDHPFPDYDTHLVFIPKKDIKDLGNLSAEELHILVKWSWAARSKLSPFPPRS